MLTDLSSPMSNTKIYLAEKIFTGNEMLHQHAIVVKDDMVTDIADVNSINKNAEIIRMSIKYLINIYY